MNCALCNCEIAAQSAINGTMCARCGAYAAGAGRTPPVQDVIKVLPGHVFAPSPGPTPETTIVDEEPKQHHHSSSKKTK